MQRNIIDKVIQSTFLVIQMGITGISLMSSRKTTKI